MDNIDTQILKVQKNINMIDNHINKYIRTYITLMDIAFMFVFIFIYLFNTTHQKIYLYLIFLLISTIIFLVTMYTKITNNNEHLLKKLQKQKNESKS